ncbi:MAG: 16S rRNA (guanine(966)-N(2))-methyltransferase RsmD [Clostridiaceae bacterium]|nr:16S rRNA (guanine(966)-N(2))-methyltransferase RsmD [Clostridiaceae bacterium]
MRIISGSLRGKRLEPPKGMTTRPTTDRVKEALFSIIQFDIEGARVLDLFAGSGQLGLEALSRGAESCDFAEHDRNAAAAVAENISACGIPGEKARLHRADSFAFLSGQKPASFDIVLLDPPYGGDLLRRALELLCRFDILTENGIIICEKDPNDVIEPLPDGLALTKEYKYGQIMLCKIIKGEKQV